MLLDITDISRGIDTTVQNTANTSFTQAHTYPSTDKLHRTIPATGSNASPECVRSLRHDGPTLMRTHVWQRHNHALEAQWSLQQMLKELIIPSLWTSARIACIKAQAGVVISLLCRSSLIQKWFFFMSCPPEFGEEKSKGIGKLLWTINEQFY